MSSNNSAGDADVEAAEEMAVEVAEATTATEKTVKAAAEAVAAAVINNNYFFPTQP